MPPPGLYLGCEPGGAHGDVPQPQRAHALLVVGVKLKPVETQLLPALETGVFTRAVSSVEPGRFQPLNGLHHPHLVARAVGVQVDTSETRTLKGDVLSTG